MGKSKTKTSSQKARIEELNNGRRVLRTKSTMLHFALGTQKVWLAVIHCVYYMYL